MTRNFVLTLVFFCILFINQITLDECSSITNRKYKPEDFSNYVNDLGETNKGGCTCNNVTYLCDCNVKVSQLGQSQAFQVQSTLAAVVVEEMKREEMIINGQMRGSVWPPAEPFVPKNPMLGILTGVEEPLKHLQMFPWTTEDIDTKFLLFTRNNRNTGIPIGYESPLSLDAVPSNCDKMIFVIHGFRGSSEDDPYQRLKRALLDFREYSNPCVVMTDWRRGAAVDPSAAAVLAVYAKTAANTVLVGRQVGLMSFELVQSKKIRADDIHLIGFSLGSHVAHFASKWFTSLSSRNGFDSVKIGRITGLDPAARHFQGYNGSYLNSNDAKFVDIIHTSAVAYDGNYLDFLSQRFGFSEPVGTVDFYPNGGTPPQPDCEAMTYYSSPSITEYFSCHHNKATDYFTDSLLNLPLTKFISVPCDDYSHLNQCKTMLGRRARENPRETAISCMGIEADHYSGRGKQFLTYAKFVPNVNPTGVPLFR